MNNGQVVNNCPVQERMKTNSNLIQGFGLDTMGFGLLFSILLHSSNFSYFNIYNYIFNASFWLMVVNNIKSPTASSFPLCFNQEFQKFKEFEMSRI